ncbi:hypothetical protein [Phenylobacterium sp.]|uniref:hypothetical protein n=1 Tax=Phenylobacterium sp. TaxID=1871053 RepID=UPI002F3E4EDB
MRTFTCLMSVTGSSVPTLSFILAEDEVRARLLVLRELLDNKLATSVEIYEGASLLWTELAAEV